MSDLKIRIRKLEKEAAVLEPKAKDRKVAREKVIAYSEEFIDNIANIKSYVTPQKDDDAWEEAALGEKGSGMDKLLNFLKLHVDTPGINSASGGHLGYIPGGGVYYAALGDYLVDIFNRYAGVTFSAPGAVRIERTVLGWLAEIIGFPENCGGDLTSGSSIGTLMVINSARENIRLKSRDYEKAVVYLSEQMHHSFEKALRIAGMADCVIRQVPIDSHHRMISASLEKQIELDLHSGLTPWLVTATAGTTDTGAIDPLAAIGEIAKRHKVWYHIDAAYGGFFILTDEGRNKLQGMETSDSIVLDPHKGLSIPFGTGAVLIKNRESMVRAHNYHANYMQDAKKGNEDLSPSDVSPELTKHFRGLRLWLPLKIHGTLPFQKNLEEKLLLARYFYEEITKLPMFQAGNPPDLSIVTFRYLPENGNNVNELNELLVKEIHKDGRIFITSTTINGKVMLRMAVVSFRTHLNTIDLAISLLKELSKKLLVTK